MEEMGRKCLEGGRPIVCPEKKARERAVSDNALKEFKKQHVVSCTNLVSITGEKKLH